MKVYFGTVDREGQFRERIRQFVKIHSDPLVVSEEIRGYAYDGYDVSMGEYDTDLDFQQMVPWARMTQYWNENDKLKGQSVYHGYRPEDV